MTSELRPASEVWSIACGAYEDATADLADLPMRDMVVAGDEAAAAVIEADREAVRAEMRQALIATGEAAATHLKELAKFKALAETLAGALHHRGGPLCPARYYGDAQCTCGVADALLQYKEARDD